MIRVCAKTPIYSVFRRILLDVLGVNMLFCEYRIKSRKERPDVNSAKISYRFWIRSCECAWLIVLCSLSSFSAASSPHSYFNLDMTELIESVPLLDSSSRM